MPTTDGPFKVPSKANDNSYKIDLPWDYGILASFNVAVLGPYFDNDHLTNMRVNCSQQGKNDEYPRRQQVWPLKISKEVQVWW